MTTVFDASRNGQKRASLNDQIQRLDKMLDGLADGLNDAVAAAVKSAVTIAVQQAVQAVLTEVFTNADVLAQIAAVVPKKPIEPQKPTIRDRFFGAIRCVGSCVAGVRVWCARKLRCIRAGIAVFAGQAVQFVVAGGVHLWMLRRFALQIGMALGIGAVVAVAAWFSGPTIASSMSGIGAFMSALALQIGFWFRGLVPATK